MPLVVLAIIRSDGVRDSLTLFEFEKSSKILT